MDNDNKMTAEQRTLRETQLLGALMVSNEQKLIGSMSEKDICEVFSNPILMSVYLMMVGLKKQNFVVTPGKVTEFVEVLLNGAALQAHKEKLDANLIIEELRRGR